MIPVQVLQEKVLLAIQNRIYNMFSIVVQDTLSYGLT